MLTGCLGVRPDPTRLALLFGASVNARDHINGNTALHWACTAGNHVVIKHLLDAGSDITAHNAKVRVDWGWGCTGQGLVYILD